MGGLEHDLNFRLYKWVINLAGCDGGIVVIQINTYLLEIYTKVFIDEIKYELKKL